MTFGATCSSKGFRTKNHTTPVPSAPPQSALPGRVAALDVYRGFVMFLIMAEMLRFCDVAKALSTPGIWAFFCTQQSHVDWTGCVLHDLIQPSFSFLVGVSLPFSIASRRSRGQSMGVLLGHAAGRALALTLLGVWLRSTHSSQTRWTFEDTLSQIGLGYLFLFAIGFRSRRFQWAALATVLFAYWAWFALWPLPGADFDFARVGVPPGWLQDHGLHGFAAHWQKNSNAAWAFDTWFLNLFPRARPFVANDGGYSTLSFIPTLGTMILGLLAGGVLRGPLSPKRKVIWFIVAGFVGLIAGWALGATGLCPVVKRIWTPSWVLFSGGWCFLLLAGFYTLLDVVAWTTWSFALRVIGMNSIAAYIIDHLFSDFISRDLKIHLGQNFFQFMGAPYEPFFHGAAVMLVYWLMLFWLFRRRIFLRF